MWVRLRHPVPQESLRRIRREGVLGSAESSRLHRLHPDPEPSNMGSMADYAFQQCINADCGRTFGVEEVLYACPACGSLIDVRYDWSRARVPDSLAFFDARRGAGGGSRSGAHDASGVWRFRELLPFAEVDDLVTIGEGRTTLQQADLLAREIGVDAGHLFLQYEGFNPSGSFKDNGMVAAFTMARRLNRSRVACASTGNTSASLAMLAGLTTTRSGQPIEAVVFVGGGKIAKGKLAQALDFGATTIQIDGDFDACMRLVQQSADRLDLYLANSVNPFRIEGQKTIMYRVLEGLGWSVPDWIVVPGGNLGNTSAFGKAFMELRELGLVDRVPRLAVINAHGANALFELYNEHGIRFRDGRVDRNKVDSYFEQWEEQGRRAETVASAIEIGRPVNLAKALRSLDVMNGVVRAVSDECILEGKALVGRFGFGCEPASGASVAGLRVLLDEGVIGSSETVVCILTGHALKDPDVTVDYHAQGSGRGGARRDSHTSDKDARTSEDDRGDAMPARRWANPALRLPADIEAIARCLNERGAARRDSRTSDSRTSGEVNE